MLMQMQSAGFLVLILFWLEVCRNAPLHPSPLHVFSHHGSHLNFIPPSDSTSHSKTFNSEIDLQKDVQGHLDELENDALVQDEDVLGYWFSLHDVDGDGKLDGNELLHVFTDYEMVGTLGVYDYVPLIDGVLAHDDLDKDGKINIQEFLLSQFDD